MLVQYAAALNHMTTTTTAINAYTADASIILQAAAVMLHNPHPQVHQLVWELFCVTVSRAAALDLLPQRLGGTVFGRGCLPPKTVNDLIEQLRAGQGTMYLHLIAALCQGGYVPLSSAHTAPSTPRNRCA